MTLILLFFLLLFVTIFVIGSRRQRLYLRLPPGPKGWPVIGNLLQLGPKPHQTLHALSKTHGPLLTIRLGSTVAVVASSADVAEKCLRTHDINFSSRPPNSGAEHLAYNYRDLVFAPYGSRWRMLRRLCTMHLFSAKAIEDSRNVREEEVARLVRRLAEKEVEALGADLGAELNKCATNALARVVVGLRISGAGREDQFRGLVSELMRLAGVFNIGDFVSGLEWLDLQGVVRKMKKLHVKLDEFFDGLIGEHYEAGDDYDMLSALIRFMKEADGEEDKLTDFDDIKAILLNLFTAGTDTTSSTIEWALSELIRQPDLLSQAQIELDSVVGRNRLVSESDLQNLPFLQAIVKETFRLHPSTPLSLPRIAAKDCEIDGYLIPQGTTLLVNVWSIARDPLMWPDESLAFKPKRFLKGDLHEGVDVKGNNFELIPFGAGRRICVGLSLGLRMVQFITATLVHAFDWSLVGEEMVEKLDMEEAYGLTLHKAMPLVVMPKTRLATVAFN